MAYEGKFISILDQLKSMWEGTIVSIKLVQQRIELNKKDGGPEHSAPCQAGQMTKELEKRIDGCLPWTLADQPELNALRLWCLCRRRTALFASAPTAGS